jgi:hypothetical protein
LAHFLFHYFMSFLWPIGPLNGLLTVTVGDRASIYVSDCYRSYKSHR